MAQLFTDGSQSLNVGELLPPQLITVTGTGPAVDMSSIGSNEVCALLSVANVTGFTSLAAFLQESTDGLTNWVTVPGVEGNATFTTVTTGTAGPQLIPFQLSNPSSPSQIPYRYVRINYTLTGTNCIVYSCILGQKKYDGIAAYQNEPAGV